LPIKQAKYHSSYDDHYHRFNLIVCSNIVTASAKLIFQSMQEQKTVDRVWAEMSASVIERPSSSRVENNITCPFIDKLSELSCTEMRNKHSHIITNIQMRVNRL